MATAPQARRAGRPRSAVLGRARITAAARRIIEARGYPALTMSALARSLGVSPSALYNHAASKQQLLQWIQEDVMAGVDSSGFGRLPLDDALRRWATSYRDVFARHAPLVPVIAVLPVAGSPRTLRMYEDVAAGFLGAGWVEEDVAAAIIATESFIFGSALDATAPLDIFDAGEHAARFPAFSGAVARQRASGMPSAEAAFALGLEALIAGLMTRGPGGRAASRSSS
jgi:AcrR family transcriptional regulator